MIRYKLYTSPFGQITRNQSQFASAVPNVFIKSRNRKYGNNERQWEIGYFKQDLALAKIKLYGKPRFVYILTTFRTGSPPVVWSNRSPRVESGIVKPSSWSEWFSDLHVTKSFAGWKERQFWKIFVFLRSNCQFCEFERAWWYMGTHYHSLCQQIIWLLTPKFIGQPNTKPFS